MNFWNTIRHFTPLEFTSPNEMDHGLIIALDWIRRDAGVPIYITSSFRVGDSGEHGTGEGVDISDNLEGNDVGSRWRYKVLVSICRSGITRIGCYDKHFHLGISKQKDQEVCWHGISD